MSIGVSFNKIFAKLGSDYKKPDAITVISPENFKEIVFPLKTSDMIYIGKKTADFLYSIGIKTIGELASTNPQVLASKLGKVGEQIYLAANGLDTAPVLPPVDDTTKSISNGFTFRHNLVGFEECRLGCDYLSEEVGARLRKHRQKCATVSVSIKDEFLRVVQKQRGINPPTNVAREISSVAMELIREVWNENKPIRMITVSASNLIDDGNFCEQIDFFDEDKYEKRQKEEKLEIAIDKIRRKFGGESIVNGAFMDSDIGIYKKKQP